jgi:hypothetical protein
VKNTCSVDECAKPSYCQRMCTTHYQRVRNHGSVEDPTLTRAGRFWRNVQVDENGHWIWIGALNAGGYGVAAGGLAHRVSWEMHRQPIPAGLHIDHVCRVTACVNPAHLDVVTAHENADRGYARNVNASRQLSKTHCLRGHEYTAENTRYSPLVRPSPASRPGEVPQHPFPGLATRPGRDDRTHTVKGLPQSTELTLHDYAYLRSWGLTMPECALRLGMSRENLRLMLKRAAQRGDTRSDYTPHVTECSGSYQSLQKRRERALRGEVA